MIGNTSVIDIRIPSDFSVTVGGVDVTPLIKSGAIFKPEINPSSTEEGDFNPPPLLWEGQIEIAQPRQGSTGVVNAPVSSVDASENVNFRAWVAPVVIFFEGQVLCTLRLAKDCRVKADGTATLELKHLAYSLRGQSPKALKGFSKTGVDQPYGAEVDENDNIKTFSIKVRTWNSYAIEVITKATNGNGEKIYTEADIDFGNSDQFLGNTFGYGGLKAINGFSAEQPGNDDSPIKKANKIIFASVHRCIESRSDERLYLSLPIPLSKGDPIIALAPQQLIEAEPFSYEPDDPEEDATSADQFVISTRVIRRNEDLPPPKQRVINSEGVSDNDDPERWPKVVPIPGLHPTSGQPIIVESHIEQRPSEPSEVGTVSRKTQSKSVVSSRFYVLGSGTDTSKITRASSTRTEEYAINRVPPITNRKPIKITEERTVLLHDLNRSRFEGDLTQVSETITETFEYDTLGNTTQYIKVTRRPKSAVLDAVAENDTEGIVAIREGYSRKILRQGINKQILEIPFKQVPQGQIDGSNETAMISDPDFDVANNIKVVQEVAVPQPALAEEPTSYFLGAGRTKFESDSPNPIVRKAFSLAATTESAQTLADVLGTLIQQRRRSIRVEHAVSSLFNGYQSFQRINLDDGRAAIQGHLVGPRISFDSQSIRAGYLAYKIGDLDSRISLPKVPVVASQYQKPLYALPVSNQAAFEGSAIIPIPLTAANGVSPYSWGVVGLPAGLSLSQSVISGIPTTPGIANITVTVTDGALATSQSTFSITVSPQPSVTPAYVRVIESLAAIKFVMFSRLLAVIRANAAILIKAQSRVFSSKTSPSVTIRISIASQMITPQANNLVSVSALTNDQLAAITNNQIASFAN